MCGRTGQAMLPEVIEARWDVRVPAHYEPRYNVAPREALATIPSDEPGAVDTQEWGLLPGWVEDPADWHYPINARAETVDEQPTFREAFQERPCLVLSSGYYEWKGERGSKQPYRVCREDREPFALAGLWESWGENGTARETVTILTCEANEVVAPIHDRMPVVLSPEDESRWLTGDAGDRRDLLDPADGAAFEAYPISTKVNDPGYDEPDVLDPLATEQGDLGEFA
jgi:putative SOS response-associated peptidase YedK